MQKYITKAVDNFFINTLGFSCITSSEHIQNGVHVSQIVLKVDDCEEIFELFMDTNLLKSISSVMLFEDEPDSETLQDLASECANLIVGNAKILLEEDKEDITASLSTPVYKGYFDFKELDDCDEFYSYTINNQNFLITLKSLVSELV